ncbi:uncharacterized protein LOC110363633 [Columba livia]|uniref:uncharacterized protein LOC110363633 n=1 Tax=Columba livia TaxID=8932 RepID=UPI0031BB5412
MVLDVSSWFQGAGLTRPGVSVGGGARRSRSTAAACSGSAVTAQVPSPTAGPEGTQPGPAQPRPPGRRGRSPAQPSPDRRAGGDAARPSPAPTAGPEGTQPGPAGPWESTPRGRRGQRGGAAGPHRRQHQVHNEAGSYPDLWLPVGLGPLAAPQIPMASITICRDTQEPCVGSVTASREGVSGSAQGEAADAPARQRTPWIYSKWCWVQRRAAEQPCSRATVQQCLCITASRATVQQCLCITASRATVQQCLCSPHAAEQPYSRAHASPQAEQLCSSACASSCSRATVLVQPAPCSRAHAAPHSAMQQSSLGCAAPCRRAAEPVHHHTAEQHGLYSTMQQSNCACAASAMQQSPCSTPQRAARSEQHCPQAALPSRNPGPASFGQTLFPADTGCVLDSSCERGITVWL